MIQLTSKQQKEKEKAQKQFDDTIITWVKIHPYNLGYAFKRASEVLKCKPSKVRYRFYNYLLKTGEVFFELKSDITTLANKRTISAKVLEELEKNA